MQLDTTKFQTDESRSNPMAVAIVYPDCPIKGVCSYIVVGFGGVIEPCQWLKENGEEASCTYDETPQTF